MNRSIRSNPNETKNRKRIMEQTNRNHLLADAGSYADAEDDGYGRVRDPNFHDWDYCNRRRRHRSRVRLLFSLDAKNNSTNNKNMNGNGNGDDDDDCYDPGWDSHAAVTCLRPMLPSPLREMTYTPRTGWNYGPASRNAPGWDRLGTGIAERIPVAVAVAVSKRRTRTHHSTADAATATSADGDSEALRVPMPSTTMITPLSWMSGLASNSGATKKAGTNRSPVESRAALPERKRAGNPAGSFPPGKRQKSSDAASVVTQSTAGESASSSAFANATMDRKVDRIVSVPPGKKVDGSAAVTVTKDLPPSRAAAASTKPAATSSSGAGAPSISPKAALHQWYGKKPRKTQIRPEHYVTWDNGKTTYEQRFTTVFLCPMTKEAFLAGPWSGAGFGGGKPVPLASTAVAPDADGLYWFPRKIMAEHAAAARAWDCWVMREPGRFDEPFRSLRFGKLEPYWPSQRPACPLNRMPATVREQFPSTDGYSGAAATHPASNTARCNDDGSANNDTNSSQTGANPTVPIQAQTTAVSGAVGNDPGTKSTKHATTTVTTIAATTITPGGSDTNNSNNSSNSNSNSNQRKPSWGETGPGTGRDAGRHQTRKHPSWDTKRNNSTDTNKDFTRNKKNREREQYRAQRMLPQGRGPHGRQTHHYQPQHRNQQPPHQIAAQNNPPSFPAPQRPTYEQRPLVAMATLQHIASQQMPGQNQYNVTQNPQQNQCLQQSTNHNPFQNANPTYLHQQPHQLQYNQQQPNQQPHQQHYHQQQPQQYSQPLSQQQHNHYQHSQQQVNQYQQNQQQFNQHEQNLQLFSQHVPVQATPTPSQPPPFGPSGNHHQAWNNEQQNAYPHASFESNNNTNRPPCC